MTDEELVERCRRGDIEAFDALVIRYQREVFYMVRAVVLDTDEAMDITQRAFIKAYKKIKRLKDKGKFKQWLFRIAINTARDSQRKRRQEMKLTDMPYQDCPSPEDSLMERERRRLLKEAINGLSRRQREVIFLRLYHGMTFNEIAEILNISPEAARSNLHFGLRNLTRRLKDARNGL